MAKIYVTRKIPQVGIDMLKEAGHEVDVNPHDRVLSKRELIAALAGRDYDAVLCLLTDTIDADIFDAAGPHCKIFANYAVGYNNIDIDEAKKRGIFVTNTPGVLTEAVAEHAIALLFAVARRVVEADNFVRAGKYEGWAPELFLGSRVSGKTLGVVGLGRIGAQVARYAAKGLMMNILYYDVKRNEDFEKEVHAQYYENLDDLLPLADFVTLHVPLLPATTHLIDGRRLGLMKKDAYLINTSRGPVIDEKALTEALSRRDIAGAALDVFEDEPRLTPGLSDLQNVVLTPHIASATVEAREAMAKMAAENIIIALRGEKPPQAVF